jgi:hypothetical protein
MFDYGLCIRDCKKCEFHSEKDGCGINYDGEPFTTTKELILMVLLVISILNSVIILGYLGVL